MPQLPSQARPERASIAPFDPGLVEVALAFARRFGASSQDVEDIAQEALLKLVTYGLSIEDPIAWLFVVVRRLQHGRRPRLETSLARHAPAIDPWPHVELSIDARRLLGLISERGRRSVWLSLAGYSEREAAEQLGCSVKATEKSLHKARRQLRRSLQRPA